MQYFIYAIKMHFFIFPDEVLFILLYPNQIGITTLPR